MNQNHTKTTGWTLETIGCPLNYGMYLTNYGMYLVVGCKLHSLCPVDYGMSPLNYGMYLTNYGMYLVAGCIRSSTPVRRTFHSCTAPNLQEVCVVQWEAWFFCACQSRTWWRDAIQNLRWKVPSFVGVVQSLKILDRVAVYFIEFEKIIVKAAGGALAYAFIRSSNI